MANTDSIRKCRKAVAPQMAPVMAQGNTGSRGGWGERGLAGRLLGLGLLLGTLWLPAVGAPRVGDDSCIDEAACASNSGKVGNNSCIAGDLVCERNSGKVGDGACLGVRACFGNTGNIGPGQCIGDQVCENNTANIP